MSGDCCKPGYARSYGGDDELSPICWDFRTPVAIASKPALADFEDYLGIAGATPSSLWLYDQAAGSSQPLPDEAGVANLTAVGTVYNGRAAVGLWDGSSYEGLLAGEYGDWTTEYQAGSNAIYDFDAATSFAMLVVFRANWVGGIRGLIGKIDTGNTQGYRVEFAATGQLVFTCASSVGPTTASRTAAVNHVDNAWHYAVAGINRTTGLIHLFTDLTNPGSAAIGALDTLSNAVPFRDGRARDNTFSQPSQRLFSTMFTGAAAEALLTAGKTATDAWWARMTTRSLPNVTTYTRNTPIATQIAYQSGAQLGERVTTFAANEVAYGWRRGYQHSSRLGLLGDPAVTNLLAMSDVTNGTWNNNGVATASPLSTNPATLTSVYDNHRGMRWCAQLTKTGVGGNRFQLASVVNGTVYTFSVWLAVQDPTYVPTLRVTDAATGAVVIATQACPVFPAAEWKRCWLTFTAPANATYRFEIHPSDPASAVGVCYAQDGQVEASSGPTPLIQSFGAIAAGSAIIVDTSAVLDPVQGAYYTDYVMDRVTGQIVDSPPGGAAPNRRHLFTTSSAFQSKIINDSAGVAVVGPTLVLLTASPASHYEAALAWYARAAGDTAAIDYAGYTRATGNTAFVAGVARQAVRFLGAANSAGTLARCCVYPRFLSPLALTGRFGPQYPATQAAMLALTGLSFDSIWLCNEATGGTTLADAIGGITLTRSSGTITQQGAVNNGGTAVDAPQSTSIRFAAASNATFDFGNTSFLVYLVCKTRTKTDPNSRIAGKANSAGAFEGYYCDIAGSSQGRARIQIKDATTFYIANVDGYDFRDQIYHPYVFLVDRANGVAQVAADIMNTGSVNIAGAGSIANGGVFEIGSVAGGATQGVDVAYAGVASGAQVEGLDPKDFLRDLGWLVEGS